MKEVVRIAHLSDIHFHLSTSGDEIGQVIETLVEDLKQQHTKQMIDLICFSGDLIDQGTGGYPTTREAFAQFDQAVVKPLMHGLGLQRDRIFLVPGNHDVNRSLDSSTIEKGLQVELTSEQEVDNFIRSHQNDDSEGIQRTLPFKIYERGFYDDTTHEKYLSLFESAHKITIDGINIGIAAINSSWRCYSNEDKGRLLVGRRQIDNAHKFLESCDLRILLAHHSEQYLCDFERKCIETVSTEKFNIALLGHNHSPETWAKSLARGTLFTSVGRCNWQTNMDNMTIEYMNGYSLVDYMVAIKTVRQYPRIYSSTRNEYVSDLHICGDAGYLEFQIGSAEAEISRLHLICDTINDSFIKTIDEDLVIYGTDTQAPCSIESLFVDPNITAKEIREGTSFEEHYDIERICREKKNYAIIGLRETGKTILLDKIVSNYLDRINELRVVPIHIKFDEYRHARFETAISQFTGLKILDVEDFLRNTKVVILVDNFLPTDSNVKKITQIKTLYETYPNVTFILAITTLISGNIPLEFVSSDLYSDFKVLDLKYFKAKQISELTEKWYSRLEIPNKKEREERIVNLLLKLELPRTPLAVSMFLWILEKQEDYQPANQSTMLENFIEKMFKKHSREEVFYRDFDYRNKEKLLTHLAKSMFKGNLENYSIKYSDLLDNTTEYLLKRKFDFDPVKIIGQFLDIGLMSKYVENSTPFVRFRFNCFFQYFLMKNMDDQEFFTQVMSEKSFLAFSEEISLFTGIKRDRSDILKIVVDRMELAFAEVYAFVAGNQLGFDGFFETQISIAEQLNRGFIETVQEQRSDTQKEVELMRDKLLESTNPTDSVQKKKFTLSKFQTLEKCWTLAASVLRNTEETEEDGLKLLAFAKTIKASMGFVSLYKYLFVESIKKNRSKIGKEELIDSEIVVRFLPILHELWVYDVMGTAKLNLVVEEHLDCVLKDKNVPQLEKFICTFLLADGKSKNGLTYIKKFIGQIRMKYIYDMTLFKLVTYYFLRSNKKLDIEYENMIADIILLSRGESKQNKGRVIQSYRDKKTSYVSEIQQGFGF